MRIISNTYYEVAAPNGFSWRLDGHYQTADEALEAGKASDERQKALGYKPTPWIVTKTMWSRTLDDNDVLISESSATVTVHFD